MSESTAEVQSLKQYHITNNDVQPRDTTLDLQQIIGLYGRRAKAYQKGAGNKYLCSVGDDWFCVVRSRGNTYRLIGRVSCNVAVVKHTTHYDIYASGTLADMVSKYKCLVHTLSMSWSMALM